MKSELDSGPLPIGPRASIIVLAWRSTLVKRCLESIALVGGETPFEVIVVLNGASPSVVDAVDAASISTRVVRSPVNLGFAGGCNRGARAAAGEFLVFLNDDTEVEPGWLDALVHAAADDPTIGAVGSRLLFPDGTVQEAGAVVFSDGSTVCVARGDEDEAGTYLYRRTVDYCSANALLVRRSTWDTIGGFDEGYFPAYYEDVDLCLSIQATGQRVVYQPASKVRHHESASLDPGYKLFVHEAMRTRFVAKWQVQLTSFLTPEPRDPDAVERAVQRGRGISPRVLIIDDRPPRPNSDSESPSLFRAVAELARSGWIVDFAPSEGTDSLDLGRRRIGALGVEIVTDIEGHLRRPVSHYDVIVISRRNNAQRFIAVTRRLQPQAVLLYNAEGLDQRGPRSQPALAADCERHPELTKHLEPLSSPELTIATAVDQILCRSTEDAAGFEAVPDHAPITVLPLMAATRADTGGGFASRRDMVFTTAWQVGTHSPLADGLRWFVLDVIPLILAKLPWVRLEVTGASPPADIARLASRTVRLLGPVDDLGPVHGRARLAVAPLRCPAGLQINTVEALSSGLPVVSTPCGAEGIPDAHRFGLVIATDARAFAGAVIELLSNRRAWEAQRQGALRYAARPDRSDPVWPRLLGRLRPA